MKPWMGVTAASVENGNASTAAADPQQDSDTAGIASATACEPTPNYARDGIPDRPDLIDEASGKYGLPAEAADQTLAQDELSARVLALEPDCEFVTASDPVR